MITGQVGKLWNLTEDEIDSDANYIALLAANIEKASTLDKIFQLCLKFTFI